MLDKVSFKMGEICQTWWVLKNNATYQHHFEKNIVGFGIKLLHHSITLILEIFIKCRGLGVFETGRLHYGIPVPEKELFINSWCQRVNNGPIIVMNIRYCKSFVIK